MKLLLYFAFLLIVFSPAYAFDAKQSYESTDRYYIFRTKFGDLKFVRNTGELSALADKIVLDGKDFVSSKGRVNGYGASLSLMSGNDSRYNGIDVTSVEKNTYARPLTKRLIVFEGASGNCVTHIIILDFTKKKPYVSERFGHDPELKACIGFQGARWGKKESFIDLFGPMKYIYYTGGRVFGPIE